MPKTKVLLFQEDDGTVPLLEWLAELGQELRRHEADFLRDEIYELRVGLQAQNYRMLYFFHGKAVVVLSHGLVKEREVPTKEID